MFFGSPMTFLHSLIYILHLPSTPCHFEYTRRGRILSSIHLSTRSGLSFKVCPNHVHCLLLACTSIFSSSPPPLRLFCLPGLQESNGHHFTSPQLPTSLSKCGLSTFFFSYRTLLSFVQSFPPIPPPLSSSLKCDLI